MTEEQDIRNVILEDLRNSTEAAVSTFAGEYIRNRMMHYAVTDDFTFYLASMKNDPKIMHIINNPSINLIILRKKGDPSKYMDVGEFSKWSETEVIGTAELVRDKNERRRALELLYNRSPVVKLLVDNKQDSILDIIKVTPHQIRYKRVADILRGRPPNVIDFAQHRARFEEFSLLKKKLKIWYNAIRAPFLVAGIPSVLLGTILAYITHNVFDPILFVLTLIGIVIGHISVNLLNDYYDHKLNTDVVNQSYIRPFSGGSRVLQMGLLSPLEVLSIGLISLLIFLGIGIYITLIRGWIIIALGLIGAFFIYSYNAPPLRLSGKGLGELVVGISFGILIALGSYVVQTGVISYAPIYVSIPVTITVALILLINEFPDYEADKSTGRRNLVVILGRRRARWVYIAGIVILYGYILVASVTGLISMYSLIALISLPASIYAIKYLMKYYDEPSEMIPSYVATIITHLGVGFLLVIAYMMQAIQSITMFITLASIIALYVAYELLQVNRDLKAFLLIKSRIAQ